jgi:hypothetical protein
MRHIGRILFLTVAVMLLSGIAAAAEQKLMHCFYFSPVEAATDADWQAFYKATEALPGKIPGLEHVWYGKLVRPFRLPGKPAAEGQPAQPIVRTHGVCMAFANQGALKTYADHPAHTEWGKVYEKVRQYGTNTFDILQP